jgi:protein-tyrosine kinase
MSLSSIDLVERAAARLPLAPPSFEHFGNADGGFAAEPVWHAPPQPEEAEPGIVHRLEREGTIDWSAPRTPIMEEMRLIKRRLLSRVLDSSHADNSTSRLIMITSARPGEGKTFTASNLALSISLEEDYDVVLVDADIHRQTLRRNLGIRPIRGLLDVLQEPMLSLGDVMLRTDIPQLTILTAGTPDRRAPELLAGSRMGGLMENLAIRYPDRIIIFDAPPCLVSSDASALASHVGQALLVVEASRTQEHEVVAALQMLSTCPDVSMVLNKARSGGSASYGSYGAY